MTDKTTSKLLVAVFGHYDSRGGAMTITIPEATPAEVMAAFQAYDSQFGYDPNEGVTMAGVGREVDVMMHKLVYGDNRRPSFDDFLYVAELHYPEGVEIMGHDVEYEEEFETLINETSTNWLDIIGPPSEADSRYGSDSWAKAVIASCIRPAQLEVVVLPEELKQRRNDQDEDAWLTDVIELSQILFKQPNAHIRLAELGEDACGLVIS